MKRRTRQGGMALILAALVALVAGALLLFHAGASPSRRDEATARALAQAREALLGYAADRPVGPEVGPGFLPCPDLDDDGWAEPICGSLAGDRGQEQRLGRLPWKTLGLADLRDGHGERLWYAVSTRYKGLLNCAASAACVDHTPASALGTITVRDSSAAVTHDGTLLDPQRGGAVAVVISPGPPLARLTADGAREQLRSCAAGDCDANGRCVTEPPWRAARCDPANYLDRAPAERSGEDNADFHDRSDAMRPRNTNGFIQGPVQAGGATAVNDRLLAIGHGDVMPRVMRRVALEVAQCLASYASRPENAGRLPRPEPACSSGEPAPFGRVPDAWLAEGPGMRERCTLGATQPAWWTSWKPFVFYAPAAGYAAPSPAAGCADPGACIDLVDGEGHTIATARRAAIVVAPKAGECASARLDCDAAACSRLAIGPGRGHRHDAVVALP